MRNVFICRDMAKVHELKVFKQHDNVWVLHKLEGVFMVGYFNDGSETHTFELNCDMRSILEGRVVTAMVRRTKIEKNLKT
jgi:hypothetical protein